MLSTSRVLTRLVARELLYPASHINKSFQPSMQKMSYFEDEQHVTVYNKSRPSPPQKLVEIILDYLQPEHQKPLREALDIGCGSGQSTEVLAPYFERVTGIDPSKRQINEAQKRNTLPNVDYRVGSAEKIDYPDCSVHLVTASQACHWFDLPKFYKEVGRVLIPGGILAMYGYLLPKPLHKGKSEELSNIVMKFYQITLGNYIPEESRKVYLENYKGDDFMNVPFAKTPPVRDETASSEVSATVADLVDFLNSGSAYQNFLRKEGQEKASVLLKEFEKEIMATMGASTLPHETPLDIQYKYFLIMAKKPSQ